jgi:hypothetical protein
MTAPHGKARKRRRRNETDYSPALELFAFLDRSPALLFRLAFARLRAHIKIKKMGTTRNMTNGINHFIRWFW